MHEFVQKLVNDFFGSKKTGSGRGRLELWLAVGFGFGLYSFFKGFRVYREYRVIEDTPEMPIRSIPMGLVQVRGKTTGEALSLLKRSDSALPSGLPLPLLRLGLRFERMLMTAQVTLPTPRLMRPSTHLGMRRSCTRRGSPRSWRARPPRPCP